MGAIAPENPAQLRANSFRGSIWTIARLLLWSNLRSRHRRTLLGYLWLVLPGLVLALTFSVLRRAALFDVGAVPVPYPLFVLSGMFLWQSFGEAIVLPIQQLNQQRRFLALIPAPFEAVLLAALGEVSLNAMIRLAILAAAMLAFGLAPNASWLLVAGAAMLMIAAGFVVGLLAAPFAQLFDDVAMILTMAITYAMLISPVLYPISADSLLALNPLAAVLGNARQWMAGLPALDNMVPAAAIALALIVPGWWINVLSRPHIAARAH